MSTATAQQVGLNSYCTALLSVYHSSMATLTLKISVVSDLESDSCPILCSISVAKDRLQGCDNVTYINFFKKGPKRN